MKAEGIEETGTTEEEMTNALVRARSHLKLMVCYISLIILAIFTFFIIIVSHIHIFYLFQQFSIQRILFIIVYWGSLHFTLLSILSLLFHSEKKVIVEAFMQSSATELWIKFMNILF